MGIFDFLRKKDSSNSLITRSDANCPQVKEDLIENNLTPYIENLTKSKSRSAGSAGKSEGQIPCPYCEVPLREMPKKKKTCPACGNYIYVRTKQSLFPSVLLKEEDALATDEYEKLKAYGVTKKDFTNEKTRLSKGKKVEVSSIDVCLSLYDKLIQRTKDLSLLKLLYFEKASLLYNIGGDYFDNLQISAEIELTAYKQQGVKKVSILTCGDVSCPECKKLSGKVYTTDKALKEKPVPCKACSFKLHDGREGWCRCQYIPSR